MLYFGMILAVILSGEALANESYKLRVDPFDDSVLRESQNSQLDAIKKTLLDKDQDNTADEAKKALSVKAIMFFGDAATVNVNGKMLQLGDEINGYTIADIKENEVSFKKEGKQFIVPLVVEKAGSSYISD